MFSLKQIFENKIQVRKLRKITSVKNWKLIYRKKQERVILERWEPDINGMSVGIGVVSGVRMQNTTFKKYEFVVKDWLYDEETDSWFLKNDNDKIYRAAWSNAFQNQRYYMLKSREKVNKILSNVKETCLITNLFTSL